MGRVSLSALALCAMLGCVLVPQGGQAGSPSSKRRDCYAVHKTIDSLLCSGLGNERCDKACKVLHCAKGGYCRISPIITYDLALSGSRSSESSDSDCSVDRVSESTTSESDSSGEDWECMCIFD